ncbi:MAG: hypothetical protein Q7R70_00665 [Candidatus Diapherotrites archaeon]|nr:hypothetical protein [Candidatus Diapherotrites archaeon]
MPEIISSIAAFAEKYKGAGFLNAKEDSRINALKRYFQKGGVARFSSESKDSFPKLIYPSKPRVQQLMQDSVVLKDQFERKLKDWKKANGDAKVYHLKLHAKKLASPTYWKHVGKKITDKDYRDDAEKVKLPAELISDKKYKAMVEMFVNNLDYRKQLSETVQNSIVYKNSGNRLAKHLDEVQEFRTGISEDKIKDISKKLSEVNADLEMFETIKKMTAE